MSFRFEKCVLIGYSTDKKAYKLLSMDSKNVFYSRDVRFYENIFPFKQKTCDITVVENTSEVDHMKFFNSQMLQSPNDDGNDTSVKDGSMQPLFDTANSVQGNDEVEIKSFKDFLSSKFLIKDLGNALCGDPNHLIEECPKPPKDKNQRAFVGGSWSDNGKEDDEKAKDETCLVAQASNEICLGVDLEPDEWIKHSGCSKHMTGNRKLFSTYKAYNGGNIIFGSNLRGRGIRKKGLYVMKLGNKPKDKFCLATIDENSTLWHRRLGHANMYLIQSLASKELVRT
ncbi:retrovirus-related pol polyprotein from transposon TNT 1-94 [Tanacetum coccineum]|uniref:Retrovirus-related pol polyprotein from transposon TNT 1-94 n=1 Tax=Tanacetum coccineum TaxID=301880 RepID=A0ABQ5IKF7_9ASTR